MSLNWNLSEIKDNDNLCWTTDGTMRGATECLIYATMFVGLYEITDKNVSLFKQRLRAWEHAVGFLSSGDSAVPFDFVDTHVGLRTNASYLTDRKFKDALAEAALNRAKEELRYASRPNNDYSDLKLSNLEGRQTKG